MVPGEQLSLQPVFHYYEPIPPFFEGFENSSTNFNTDQGDTVFVPVTDNVLTGQGSKAIMLDTEHDLFVAVSTKDGGFTNGSSPAFLEIDHRSDTRFLIGAVYQIDGQTTVAPYVYVSPSKLDDGSMPWRHVYIDLGSAWGPANSINRQFYIQAILENGATSAQIVLDNIRVVY
jgi:hypothetical protein